MKIFLFGELTTNNISKLCPQSKLLGKFTIHGYKAYYNQDGKSFLKQESGTEAGFLIDCDGVDLWRLDQWKNVLSLKKGVINEREGIFSYFSIYNYIENHPSNPSNEDDISDFVARFESNKSLRMADLHLLVPGYCQTKPQIDGQAYLGEILSNSIQLSNDREFNSDFLKNCERYALGRIDIKNYDGSHQPAILTLMCHNETRLCVMDIYIPAISTSAHKVLESYCGGILVLQYKGIEFNIESLCSHIGVAQYGGRRSMVFSYEKLEEESMLNLLVNEDVPMGKIMGTHFKNIISNNLAQYDTAEVYATEVTMLEMTDKIENDIFVRMQAQAVEIFFVEMLLLQDAAVSKMYDRVKKEIALERENPLRKNASAVISELIDEATYATMFTDYKQFYYPTVRVSADKVAKAFGIDDIQQKYANNRVLLEQMIKDHDAEISK